eukprot:7556224-Alexandrium_andersonii.AAC.1
MGCFGTLRRSTQFCAAFCQSGGPGGPTTEGERRLWPFATFAMLARGSGISGALLPPRSSVLCR